MLKLGLAFLTASSADPPCRSKTKLFYTGGAVTGVLFNATQSFAVAPGEPASFAFCTEDGTITGWNSSVDATNAKILVAADSVRGQLPQRTRGCVGWQSESRDGANAFVDPQVPAGFAPFNIANFGGKIFVAYAKQNDEKMDDVAGAARCWC
jgi:hypothetical protein